MQGVKTYLDKLNYALSMTDTLIKFQGNRQIDSERQIEFRNEYTVAELFPNERPEEAIRRELGDLKVAEYIETVKDTKYRNRSDLWVFGKQINSKDVYIKFRVEIVERNHIFVMFFHFATRQFEKSDFRFSNS